MMATDSEFRKAKGGNAKGWEFGFDGGKIK